MKTTFKYDHYYKYEELKSNLEFFAKKYPKLCKLEVNCVTEEGRNQYAVTLTNTETGEPLSKPGWYLDGNIHAGEVTSSMTAMYTVDWLLTNYKKDEEIKKLLDTTTVYVIPRVTPDGAETYLTTPYTLRSVNREYLPEKGGIKEEDLDGDGVIRMMRIPTKYGAWKKDPQNPDSMVLREPSDHDGEFYDIYPEGYLEESDDINLKSKKASWGLDFNRNFPYGWFPESRQPGAGKYPLSNPETKALCDFVLSHPNIGGAAIGHTSGGIILYPPGTRPAKAAFANDIKVLKEIAEMGKQELGYTPMNIFDSFMDDQENYDSGAFDDWCFQTQGIPAYTMEFWDLNGLVGVPFDWGSRSEEPMSKKLERFNACMQWVKENAPQYFSPWQKMQHPSFGEVEIGGFNYKFTHQNPPEHLLVKTCEDDARFNLRFAFAMPRLEIASVEKEKIAKDVYKITAVIGNTGYLPTNLSDEAVKLGVNKPVKAEISAEEIISGKKTEELGDLSGFSRTVTGTHFYGNISTVFSAAAKKKVSWVIRAPKGTEILIKASQEKAGTACATVTL